MPIYREATISDLPAICVLGQVVNLLHHEAWHQIFSPASDPQRDESYWSKSIENDNSTTFVAEKMAKLLASFPSMSQQRTLLAMRAQLLTATSQMRAYSLANQIFFTPESSFATPGTKFPAIFVPLGGKQQINPLWPALHSYREVVQSNKVFLPRMRSSPCSNFAAGR